MNVPEAALIDRHGNVAHIRCPYCQRIHSHATNGRGSHRFAPKCGLTLNPAQRSAGYRFTT